MTFANVIGLLAAFQFFSSAIITCYAFSKNPKASQKIFMGSLVSLLSIFAIGINTIILASEYNSFTRPQLRVNPDFDGIIFYRWLQADSFVNFLFSLPLMIYILFRSLKAYNSELKADSTRTVE